ncbi:hypothetical protein ASG76_06455 [Nocardioides sp. Soil774]|uniref:FG-GAP-like repeat-containing protein n=1 Tax=Nocardioides sp. Soil774 TaxID=1736408 RepID=UPI0007006927|nr:FG-GAP-like repeat-containing protein [Nocardioides sp. Soil774]KRE95297.1 hypothetical protein ASG76_06455 [Nocardioides sp. Soil774]
MRRAVATAALALIATSGLATSGLAAPGVATAGLGSPAPAAPGGGAGERTLRATQAPTDAPREPALVQAQTGAPLLKPGFPVDMLFTAGTYQCCGSGVLVGDVDGDPDLEVLVSGIARGTTTAVDPDGSILPGWPVGTRSHEYLSLAELDPARPGLEVVSNNFLDRITALDGAGRALPGWPRTNFIGGLHPAAAIDRDADGTDDLVYNPDDHYYSMLDAQGDDVRDGGWPLPGPGAFQQQAEPAVADLDADGRPEVVGGGASYSGESNVGAWHGDGTAVAGWPVHVEGFDHMDRIAVGDVVGAAGPEVVVEAGGSIEVLRPDGGRVARWMVGGDAGQATTTQHPALGDLDGDGDVEVVVGSPQLVHAYQGDGTELPGWPRPIPLLEPGVVLDTSPVIGDLDNDGLQDVVASGLAYDADGKRYHFVWAWDRTGVALPGFPLRMNTSTGWTPAIADLDGNGRSELVVAGYHPENFGGYWPGLYAFEYPTGTAAPADWGQYAGGPRRQGVPRQALAAAAQPGAAGDPGPFTRLADAWPGAAGSSPRDLVVLGDAVVYTARTAQAGRELWVSDGTPAGTRLLSDVRPGQASSTPMDLEVVGDRVWFTADDGVHGRELWSSDGTPTGTRLEADVVAGTASARPLELTAVGDRLFFSARTAAGRELWTSDAAGTRLVVDTTTFGYGLPFDDSHVRWIAAAGDRVTWLARETENEDGYRYVALFGSDGTRAGTQKLIPNRDLSYGSGDLLVHGGVTEAPDGRAWYRVDQRLVRTDGTTTGTLTYEWDENDDQVLGAPAPRGAQALLAASADGYGVELYRENATMVADLDDGLYQTPVGSSRGESAPADLRAWGSGWWFSARTGPSGREPWTSDGTAAGTKQVADLAPGPGGQQPGAAGRPRRPAAGAREHARPRRRAVGALRLRRLAAGRRRRRCARQPRRGGRRGRRAGRPRPRRRGHRSRAVDRRGRGRAHADRPDTESQPESDPEPEPRARARVPARVPARAPARRRAPRRPRAPPPHRRRPRRRPRRRAPPRPRPPSRRPASPGTPVLVRRRAAHACASGPTTRWRASSAGWTASGGVRARPHSGCAGSRSGATCCGSAPRARAGCARPRRPSSAGGSCATCDRGQVAFMIQKGPAAPTNATTMPSSITTRRQVATGGASDLGVVLGQG